MSSAATVVIDPVEVLHFAAPYTAVKKEVIKISNKGDKPLVFKVKTTSPKQYCVKPNAGRVEPGSHREISVELQPIPEIPTQPPRDKFLLQCCYLEPTDYPDVTDVWPLIEKEKKSQVIEKKVRCTFDFMNSPTPADTSKVPSPTAGFVSSSMASTATTLSHDDDRRLKDAVNQIEKLQAERDRLQRDLAQSKSGSATTTLRQRKEAEQFALSADPWTSPRDHPEAGRFSAMFVCLIALLAFLLGMYFK